jgi:hypothetical protein
MGDCHETVFTGVRARIESFRPELSRPALHPDAPTVLAVTVPEPVSRSIALWLLFNDPEAITDFVLVSPCFGIN